ncbi:hypothetical protein [Paraburkholderia sp. RL17-373-BIF-A]|uniref:hypothetical protein n=1 Tax=Paraburkholderia sp. RL17-373-BIF-A TaxID=3031629 RepID=UPI0038BCD9DC
MRRAFTDVCRQAANQFGCIKESKRLRQPQHEEVDLLKVLRGGVLIVRLKQRRHVWRSNIGMRTDGDLLQKAAASLVNSWRFFVHRQCDLYGDD